MRKLCKKHPWQFNGSAYEGALKDGEKNGIVTFNSVKSFRFNKKCSHGKEYWANYDTFYFKLMSI